MQLEMAIGVESTMTANVSHNIVANRFEYLTSTLFSLKITPILMTAAAVAARYPDASFVVARD